MGNTSGTWDGGDLLVRGGGTAENGFYGFSSLTPGAYLVDVVESTIPTGMDYVSGGAAVRAVTLVALQTRRAVNYGCNHTGSIGDLVYYDTDAEGVKDAGESGLPNVRVSVYPVPYTHLTLPTNNSVLRLAIALNGTD